MREIESHSDSSYFTMHETTNYFEYVVGIVSGAISSTPEKLLKAVDDLFKFLQYMKNDIEIVDGPDILNIQTRDQLLKFIQDEFTKLEKKLEKRDDRIALAIIRLDDFFKKYGKPLDRLATDAVVKDAVKAIDKKP